MSEVRRRGQVTKKRRVQRLERLLLVLLFAIPWGVSIFSLVKAHALNEKILETSMQLQEANGVLSEQQNLIKNLTERIGTLEEKSVNDEKGNHDGSGDGAAVDDRQENVPVDGSAGDDPDRNRNENVAEKEAAHKVYLTFDDGPGIYTGEILDILDFYEVKATFFVLGKEDDSSRELLREIVDRGHSLGMHSFSHDYAQIYESEESFAKDFNKIRDYLYEVTGVKSQLYRFPGGSSNTVSAVDMHKLAKYLLEQGVTFYDWNISSGDGGSVQRTVEKLVENCVTDIENKETSVILLHDAKEKRTTVDALPIIIEKILAMEDTAILPITEDTRPVQHIKDYDT